MLMTEGILKMKAMKDMKEQNLQMKEIIELKEEILKTNIPNLNMLTLPMKYQIFLSQGYLPEIELNKIKLEVYKAMTKDKCNNCDREPIYKTDNNILLCWNHSIE